MRNLLTATLVVALCGATAQAKHNKGDLENVEDLTLAAPSNSGGSIGGGSIAPVQKASRGITVQGKGSSVAGISVAVNPPAGPGLGQGAAINKIGNSGSQTFNRGAKQDLAATDAKENCPGGYLDINQPAQGPATVRSENTGKTFQATASYDPSKLQRDNFTNTKYPAVTAQDVFKNTAGFLLLTVTGTPVSMASMGFKLTDYYLSDATMKGRIASSGLQAQMTQVWVKVTAKPSGGYNYCAVGGGGGQGGGQGGAQGQQGAGAVASAQRGANTAAPRT